MSGGRINPIFSQSKRSSSSVSSSTPRKINKNKKHDIKIPINEHLESILRRESLRRVGGSKTSISTELFMFGLDNLFVYPEIEYRDGPITVHVKIEEPVYQRLADFATEWKCSMRQAAHRVFMEAVRKKQLGGVVNEKVQ